MKHIRELKENCYSLKPKPIDNQKIKQIQELFAIENKQVPYE